MGFTILVLICVIIGVVLAILDYPDFVLGILGALAGGLLGLVLMFFVGAGLEEFADKETYKVSEENIYAISDNNSVTGSFFLGSGSIDGEMKYSYLTKDERGVLMKSIEADNAYIQEDDSLKPKIERYATRHKNDWIEKYFPSFMGDSYSTITIPQDSIKYNYSIDME